MFLRIHLKDPKPNISFSAVNTENLLKKISFNQPVYYENNEDYLNRSVMLNLIELNPDLFFLAVSAYLLIAISIARFGSTKSCGGIKALLFSIVLTPVTGIFYVLQSPRKNIIKIVHYRCSTCDLEYTSYHENCPACEKEGKKNRLRKITMRTY